MEGEELSSFEKEVKDDHVLKKQVEEVKMLIQGVETAVLKDKLNYFHNSLTHEPPNDITKSNRRTIRFKKYALAASIAILIGISSFWYISNEAPNERVFGKHFSPDPGLPTTMGVASNYEFYEAMVSYKRANYATAISQWDALLVQKPNNDTLNYFIGVAHLSNSNPVRAIEHLSKVGEVENSVFDKEALYYLGMANLKAGNIEAAKIFLNQSEIEKGRAVVSELNH